MHHEKPSRNAAYLPPCPTRARHGKWPHRRCSTPRCGGWNVHGRSITHSYHKRNSNRLQARNSGGRTLPHNPPQPTRNPQCRSLPGCTALPHLRAGGTIPPDARPNCWPNGALHGVAMPPTRAARHTSRNIRFPEKPTEHNFHATTAHTPQTTKPPTGKTNGRNQQEKPPQPWSTHKTNLPEGRPAKHASAPTKAYASGTVSNVSTRHARLQ